MSATSAAVQREIDRLYREWLVRGCVIGAGIFVLLAGLDRAVTPEHFGPFLRYRIAVAAALLLAAWASRRFDSPRLHRLVGYLAILASAVVIELMILHFGGHRSIYYPGQILLGVCVLGLFPLGLGFHALVAATIYLVWLVPILAVDRITDVPYFVTANAFLLFCLGTLLILRYYTHRALWEELRLRQELAEHREQLEETVRARTADLRGEVARHAEAQESLAVAVREWFLTFESAGDGFLVLDREMRVTRANEAARRLLDPAGRGILNAPLAALFAVAGMDSGLGPVQEMARARRRTETEFRSRASDTWHAVAADPLLAGGEISGAVVVIRDVTARKRLEQGIALGKREWEETFDTISDGITIHDPDFRIVRANRAAAAMLGRGLEDLVGQLCHRCYHGTEAPPPQCPSCAAAATGRDSVSELFEPSLGKHLEIKALPRRAADGSFAGVVHIVRDITERKEAERRSELYRARLQQASKMESIGRLAGGVAHDFNNILMAILGYGELGLSQLPPDHPARDSLGVVMESGEKAAALNRQLLAFGRRQVLEMQRVNPGELVEGTARMLRRLIGEDVALAIEVNPEVRPVVADPSQLEQVVLNLAVNARDAVAGRRDGRITVAVRDVEITPGYAGLSLSKRPGPHVEISVADNGAGMDEELRERIFEPFFTTKRVGEGTGLGLAMVYGIVEQHGGFLDLESRPGAGTTMRVFIPASAELPAPAAPEAVPEHLHGSETILLAEDEAPVRELLALVLGQAGYRLFVARDGQEAAETALTAGRQIDLLLTDVVMPSLNGRELAWRFRGLFPRSRVIFLSGYPDEVLSRQGVEESEAILQKPVRPSVLLSVVREVLDGRCEYPRRRAPAAPRAADGAAAPGRPG